MGLVSFWDQYYWLAPVINMTSHWISIPALNAVYA
jgi:hypothetical protein